MKFQGQDIAIIGGGNMGQAFVAGLLSSKKVKPGQVCVTDVQKEILGSLKKKFKVRTETNNILAVKKSHVVVLCVKPQQMGRVLENLKGSLTSQKTVISVAAGIQTDFVEKTIETPAPVIRVMPNTPALMQAGAMVYCLGKHVKKKHDTLAKDILSCLGRVWKTEERHMDAVTALSGSGPAYVFYLAENMAKAGKTLNLPESLSEALARQTIFGAGLMLRQGQEQASLLRQRVTSPGGTTEAALRVMEKAGLSEVFEKALAAASQRSQELSK